MSSIALRPKIGDRGSSSNDKYSTDGSPSGEARGIAMVLKDGPTCERATIPTLKDSLDCIDIGPQPERLDLTPEMTNLMKHSVGNRIVQQLLESGTCAARRRVSIYLESDALTLSLHHYGTRVVQKALQCLPLETRYGIIHELEKDIVTCAESPWGHYVSETAIECCPTRSLITKLEQNAHLPVHRFGYHVIARCLSQYNPLMMERLLNTLLARTRSMTTNEYGNYIVQQLISLDVGGARDNVIEIIWKNLDRYSKDKYGSNVVETCLQNAGTRWRLEAMDRLVGRTSEESQIERTAALVRHKFGNYVIRKYTHPLSKTT